MSSSSSDDEDDGPELETLDISNDQYYKQVPKLQKQNLANCQLTQEDIPQYGSSSIRHSLPAYDLWRPFFPTHCSEEKLRFHHRTKLRHFNTGPQARFKMSTTRTKPFPIKSLSKTIYRYQKKLRNKVLFAINEGHSRAEIINRHLLINKAGDLTAKKGELFLFEYCEQYPPVLSQIGMATNVKNLVVDTLSLIPKRNVQTSFSQQPVPNNHSIEQTTLSQQVSSNNAVTAPLDTTTSCQSNPPIGSIHRIPPQDVKPIYFANPKPGTQIKVIENNLYRAPIFQHDIPSSDFLLIRTRNSIYIRSVQTIFAVGQTMPLVTIPPPSESAIHKFRFDFSEFYIHKMFKESSNTKPIINFDDLLKLFPDYSATSFKRRLKRRGAKPGPPGKFQTYILGDSDYGSLSLKDMRRKLVPEQYCLNMAMLAARQRLRELNYTESMISASEGQENEVLTAPWNTSKAVLDAIKKKYYLDFKGHLIDPTGPQKEGFSCVPWTKSPTEELQREEQKNETFRASSQMTSTPIKLMDRNPLAFKIKREKLERLAIYQKEAQIISQVQSKVLASSELLSSDEAESDEHEEEDILNSSFDQQVKDLDKMVAGGQSASELNFEKEEAERLQMLLDLNINQTPPTEPEQAPVEPNASSQKFNIKSLENKVLKITRTYSTDEGIIQRTEIVREPKIILLYVKKRGGTTNDINSTINGDSVCENGNSISYQPNSPMSNSNDSMSQSRRDSFFRLGPSELCRAEGVRLRISKKVLDQRSMRKQRRHSSVDCH